MLDGLAGRPFGTDCIPRVPLGRLPFILVVLPLASASLVSLLTGDLSEGVRAGMLVVEWPNAKEERSLLSEAYEGIIRDSWTVTLINEAAFPERCGGGVDAAWEASVGEVWLVASEARRPGDWVARTESTAAAMATTATTDSRAPDLACG